MASIVRQPYTKKGKDGKRVTKYAKKWYIEYIDCDGIRRRVPGFKDKTAARQKAAELEREVERQKAGLVDKFAEHRKRLLSEHVDEYEAHLCNKGVSEAHLRETMRRLRTVVRECSFRFLPDIQPRPVEGFLAALRERRRGPRTLNTYISSIRAFVSWCLRSGRLGDDPLVVLAKLNEREDVRRQRRSLTIEEYGRLLHVAELRPLAERFRNNRRGEELTYDNIEELAARTRTCLRERPEVLAELESEGRQRRLMYATFVNTGLRRGELAMLCWGALDLDLPRPSLTVTAEASKSGTSAALPLLQDLATELKAWWIECGRPSPTARVFSNVPVSLVQRLKRNLKVADIPYVDEAGTYLDVHALRHTTGTLLSKAGVAPRTAQAIMRHGSIDLTMKTYTDPRLLDLESGVASLPGLPVADTSKLQEGTGTYDDPCEDSAAVPPGASPD